MLHCAKGFQAGRWPGTVGRYFLSKAVFFPTVAGDREIAKHKFVNIQNIYPGTLFANNDMLFLMMAIFSYEEP